MDPPQRGAFCKCPASGFIQKYPKNTIEIRLTPEFSSLYIVRVRGGEGTCRGQSVARVLLGSPGDTALCETDRATT